MIKKIVKSLRYKRFPSYGLDPRSIEPLQKQLDHTAVGKLDILFRGLKSRSWPFFSKIFFQSIDCSSESNLERAEDHKYIR